VPSRTPYTPFSAFASKQNPFDFTFGAHSSVPTAPTHWLDDTDDPLAGLYNKILRFVERDLVKIMDAAERICVRSGSRVRALGTAAATRENGASGEKSLRREEAGAFDVLANVVWVEVARAIMDELGSIVFAAGKPDEFRKVSSATPSRDYSKISNKTCFSITRRLRRSLGSLSSWRPQWNPSRRCGLTRPTLHLNDAGSFLCTSSCDGRRLSPNWRSLYR
jgi:hypothetical protein